MPRLSNGFYIPICFLLFFSISPFRVQALYKELCEIVDPAPPDRVCGERGALVNLVITDYDANNQTAFNIAECAKLAFFGRFPALSYNNDTKLCSMLATGLRGTKSKPVFKPDNASDFIFYNHKCFDCPPPCPQPTDGQNILFDGGFEFDSDLIAPWSENEDDTPFNYTRISPGFHSPHALLLGVPEFDYNSGGGITQMQKVCSGHDQFYLLTLDYKFSRLTATIDESPQLRVNFGNIEGFIDLPGSHAGVVDEPWRSLAFSGSTEPGSKEQSETGHTFAIVDIAFFGSQGTDGAPDRVAIDNVKLVAVPKGSFPPPTKGENVIRNGGFEDGKLAPWTSSQGAFKFVPGSTLSKAPGNKFAIKTSDILVLAQNVTGLVPNLPYLISFDYKVDFGDKSHTPDIEIRPFSDQFFTALGPFVNNKKSSINWVWTPTKTHGPIEFLFDGGYTSIILDNFAITKVASKL